MRQPDGSLKPDKRTLTRARRLRRDMTAAEKLLWHRLRDRRAVHKFRRQHPFGVYVLDFFCDAAKVVVEVEGWSHADTALYDAARVAFLESHGFLVVRVSNDEVLRDAGAVVEGLYVICKSRV